MNIHATALLVLECTIFGIARLGFPERILLKAATAAQPSTSNTASPLPRGVTTVHASESFRTDPWKTPATRLLGAFAAEKKPDFSLDEKIRERREDTNRLWLIREQRPVYQVIVILFYFTSTDC
jgi:hypothetical protein